MSSSPFRRKIVNYIIPLGGFALGWVAFSIAESNNCISESAQRRISIANLKLQLHLQKMMPISLVEKYGYPQKLLMSMIDSMEKGYTEEAMQDRATFDEILSQCELSEQLGFLEEHASEEIPYFYIADIFHSWARLHEGSIMHAEQLEASDSVKTEPESVSAYKTRIGAGPLLLRDLPEFNSDILCHALWEKMLNNVVPFDVSIRALCVLAVNNKANARRLAALGSMDDLLTCYEAYKAKQGENEKPSDLIDSAEVYAATLFFLRAVNDASVHRRWLPGIGRPSTGPYPLAARVDADRWCRSFAPSMAAPRAQRILAEPAALLADIMTERLKCDERVTKATEVS